MTLTVKFLLIAALILSIIIPFGYFLIGERNKKRYKRALGTNLIFLLRSVCDRGDHVVWRKPGAGSGNCRCSRLKCNGIRIYCSSSVHRTFLCGRRYSGGQRGQCSPWCYQRGLQRAWKISDLCRSCRRCLPVWSDHLLHDPGTVII